MKGKTAPVVPLTPEEDMFVEEPGPALHREPEETVPHVNPEWLYSVRPRKEPFFPQIEDNVVYSKLGTILLYQC